MKLEWSAYALADREAIFDYVAADSARAAVMLDERIESRVETLADFPESGRPGRIDGTRELVIAGTSYIAAYRADTGTFESCVSCICRSYGRRICRRSGKAVRCRHRPSEPQ
ncbi:type II toxin-antitoxin system RelE/ParE family toxin [Bosea sp. PAMC 26642]|uniref:type II toxin-antitoxin system RelE/ParE family toxin n=1 Tax=Bosea sp. (strain PAMC 26642) TaxID=1792307 RepID=UPI000A648897